MAIRGSAATLLGALLTVAYWPSAWIDASEPISNPMEFLQTHCIDCHGEKKQKGDRRFDSLTLDFHDLDTAWAWEEILAIFPGSTMSATIPDGSTTNYFPATDERGLMVRTESRLAA
jgi:hypothetical protein